MAAIEWPSGLIERLKPDAAVLANDMWPCPAPAVDPPAVAFVGEPVVRADSMGRLRRKALKALESPGVSAEAPCGVED